MVEILAPDGYEAVLHVHHQEDEGFYILEGEMTFYVGEQTIEAHLARLCLVPRTYPTPSRSTPDRRGCSSFRLRAWRASSGRWESRQGLSVPPQPEEPPDEAEMERMAAIADRYRAEILGPLPNQGKLRQLQ